METEVLKIKGCEDPLRSGDVVFVHGLGGNGRDYWVSKRSEREPGSWLEWLAQDCPRLGIWSLEYQVEPFFWRGGTMPLADRAVNVLDRMVQVGLGQRPLVFVTHSLGGLLVKQMLRHALEIQDPRWLTIVDQVQGISFLATPHSGSDLVSFVQFLGTVLGSSVSVKELQANEPLLRGLNQIYQNNAPLNQISIQVYFETQPIRWDKGSGGDFLRRRCWWWIRVVPIQGWRGCARSRWTVIISGASQFCMF